MDELNILLQRELDSLLQEKSSLESTLFESRKRLGDIETRIRHIEGLLGPSQDQFDSNPIRSSAVNPDIADLAEQVLLEASPGEVHYRSLARAVRSRGGLLGGKRPESVLIARLVNDERFVRPTRKGYYALRKDYPDATSVGSRHRGGRRAN